MPTVLCVIPVRGGSKGIPRKNLKPIAGKPLLQWTIGQALDAKAELAPEGTDLRVVVSTDDDELAALAREAGAEVPFMRPAELAQDTTATEPVIEHAIEFFRAQGTELDGVMLLQATSPLRLPGTISRAVRQFLDGQDDSLVGVVPHPPFLWTMGDPVQAQYPVMNRPRRQDMAPEDLRYYENGSLYITSPRIYDEFHNRLGGRIGLFVMDEVEGVDIDTPLDFQIAEAQLERAYPHAASPDADQPEH